MGTSIVLATIYPSNMIRRSNHRIRFDTSTVELDSMIAHMDDTTLSII